MSDGNVIAEAQKRALEIAAKLTAGGGVSNGAPDDGSRKRPHEESGDGPDTKRPPVSTQPSIPDQSGMPNPKLIAQAAISRITGQLGLPQSTTVEIKIPNRMVGLVIGRQGEMINKLQGESGAKIQVAPDGSEINGERQVSISGTPDTVQKAKMLVSQVIEEAGGVTSVVSMNLEPGQEILEMMIPAIKVGLIIGKGGEMIKMLQERAGCKMQMIQDGPYANTPEKPLRMTGFGENCRKARQLVLELMEQKDMERQQSGVKPRIDLPDPQGPQVQTGTCPIPANKCGLIIGKGGDTIRQLMVQTSCFIELDRGPSPNPHEKVFNIRGLPQNIQMAQQMIRQKLEGGGIPNDPYAGMGYGGPMFQPQMGGAPGGNPWGQYGNYGGGGGYPGYGANPGQPQQQPQAGGGGPGQGGQSVEAAWAAYYQQLQAWQQQQQQQAGGNPPQGQQPPQQQQGGQVPTSGGGGNQQPPAADVQAQWAEYYRQMNLYYQQQQQQQGGMPPGGQPGQQMGVPPQHMGGPPPPDQK